MPAAHTRISLTDVEDSAPHFGMGDDMEARFANGSLDLEQTGISHQRLSPGKRQPFGHRHNEAEEVYVVLGGSGRLKLDDEVIELERLDAVRVAPRVMRCFEGGPGGIEILACGPHHDDDVEMIPGWWSD